MKRVLLVIAFLLVVAVGLIFYLGLMESDGPHPKSAPLANEAEQVLRGKYLAQAGGCMGCHTVRGGTPYAGGRAIQTPFGAIYGSNITPDNETGIGTWTSDDFWRALHYGKSKGGKLLYPAFPYPNFTRITRADADAMFAYFQSLPPVRQPNKEPELRFPFNNRMLLVAWRALYFRSGEFVPEKKRSAEWNRGAYLVEGLGHCSACHTPRNVLGATVTTDGLSGALIPMLNWYAPSLTSETESGLGSWEVQHIEDLLKTGVSARGVASGPMSEVVWQSLQYLSDSDIRSMAIYLKAPPQSGAKGAASTPENEKVLKAGAALYEKYCVECHKARGEGAPPHYPALAGNRGVVHEPPVNPIRITLYGGYPPSTEGNPRPFGMPPFSALLSDAEVAALVSYIRNEWGNQASMVSTEQVNRYRAVPLD